MIINVSTNLKERMGKGILDAMQKALYEDPSIMRMHGAAVAVTSVPVHLQMAVFARDFFCVGDAWRAMPEIQAIVRISIDNLQKEIDASNEDEELISEMKEIKQALIDWRDNHDSIT